MMDHRVYFIGASGTGKTTLAKVVSDQLQIPHFDSDDYYHYPTDPPYQKERSPEERARLLSEALRPHSSWTLSGGAGTWTPPVDFKPTLVVFIYLPLEIRLARLLARERRLYGSRIESGGDMENLHQEFMQWTKGYDDGSFGGTNCLPAHEAYLATVRQSVLRLEGSLTTEEQISLVIRSLGND
jgi:adenylate kinase family enzyme